MKRELIAAAWCAVVILLGPRTLGEDAAPPVIQSLRFYAGISYTGRGGVNYELQFSTNVNNPQSWLTLTNVVLDTNRLFFVDLDSPGKAAGFYRLHEPQSGATTPLPSPTAQSRNRAQEQTGARVGETVQRVALSAHWDETVDPDHDCQVTLLTA
jgi:hypothetical protein